VSGAGGKALATTTVIVQVMGRGTVGGGGGQISCGDGSKSCYATYVLGASVTITATAPVGWTFSGWDGSADCSGTSHTCTVPLNGTIREETAEFTPVTSPGTSTLTVTPPDNGSVGGGDIDCGTDGEDCDWVDLIIGSTITLIEEPDTGYGFAGWGGGCTGTANHCTLTMDTDRTVTATFTQSTNSHVLSVSVTGNGTVTGGGIACTSAGGSGCSATEPANSEVTLTATPGSGGSFDGWGGACAGTSTTCTISMTSDRSVTAAFSGGTSSTVPLAVSVTGSGKVTGGGIDCGSGATTCNANVATGSRVTLTGTPASGATFGGWGGACSGVATTCTVTMNAAKAVSATFKRAGSPPSGPSGTLRSAGRPIVERGRTGFAVTLRFRTSQQGTAHVRAFRAGRVMTAFSFPVAAGPVTIGPFPVASPGYYTFEVTLGPQAIAWKACLGRCGAAATGHPFTVTREAASVFHAGAAWSVTVHFRTTLPAGLRLRVYRGATLALDRPFAAPAGRLRAGPFLLSPGYYVLRLTATDAYGRVRALTWFAVLP